MSKIKRAFSSRRNTHAVSLQSPCAMTDRQTDRQTARQTDNVEHEQTR